MKTLSEIFKSAHELTKSTIKSVDNYSANFSAALKIIYKQEKESKVINRLMCIGLKGATYRLLDLDEDIELRIFARDFKEIDFISGSVFECKYEAYGDRITELEVLKEHLADSSKERVKLNKEDYKVGDIYENVPIKNFGSSWGENGIKVAYAYFK